MVYRSGTSCRNRQLKQTNPPGQKNLAKGKRHDDRLFAYGQVLLSGMHSSVFGQYLYVAGHLHVPAMQGMPGGQTFPHEPQLFLSFTMSIHEPLQNALPDGQMSSHVQVVVLNCSPEPHWL